MLTLNFIVHTYLINLVFRSPVSMSERILDTLQFLCFISDGLGVYLLKRKGDPKQETERVSILQNSFFKKLNNTFRVILVVYLCINFFKHVSMRR